MSDTRRPRSSSAGQHDALRALLERMDQRQQAGFQEVHTAIQGVRDHLGRTDARVEGLAQDLQREVTHIDTRLGRMYETNQTDISALRAALEAHERETMADAAKGAAEGAAQGVAKAIVPDDPVKAIVAKLIGRLGPIAVGVIMFSLLIDKGPGVARAISGLWQWLANIK